MFEPGELVKVSTAANTRVERVPASAAQYYRHQNRVVIGDASIVQFPHPGSSRIRGVSTSPGPTSCRGTPGRIGGSSSKATALS